MFEILGMQCCTSWNDILWISVLELCMIWECSVVESHMKF